MKHSTLNETARAKVTRTYNWEPEHGPVGMVPSRTGERVVIAQLSISKESGSDWITVKYRGLAIRKDGSAGRSSRSGTWFQGEYPDWVRALVDDMPTPSVVLS